MTKQTEEQPENNTKQTKLPEVVNPRHKQVMDLLLTGMAKSKAYQQIYPKCSSVGSACKQVRAILANPENKAYFDQATEHKKYYIDQKNQITLDGTANILRGVITQAQNIVHSAEKSTDQINALKLMKDTAIEHAKLLGQGTYDPAIKYQIEAAKEQLKQIQAEQENKDKLQEPQDNALEALLS
jgi:hypothetical protein